MSFSHFNKEATKHDIIFGVHPILEAIHAGKEIEKILIQHEGGSSAFREILNEAKLREIPVQRVPVEKLNRLTRANHQGIIAFASAVSFQPLEQVIMNAFDNGTNPMVIILDRVTDVRNLGAIARSAECAGAALLIVPVQGSAQFNADAVKTSAGALSHLPVHRSPNLKNTLQYLKDSGFSIVAVTEYASEFYYNARFEGPVALILGSEENGISKEYMRWVDQKVKIPMAGKTESLNVSVAAGIMIFEVVRQRLQGN